MLQIDKDLLNNNYAHIKAYIDTLDITGLSKEEAQEVIGILKCDSRKNVQRLGVSLEKEQLKFIKEVERVTSLYNFDRSYMVDGFVAGVDEVGRGPLAGPIVAAAVILNLKDLNDIILYINDSKSLSAPLRESLSTEIKSRALSYTIAECSNDEIDQKGISYCNNKIFIQSVQQLKPKADLVLSDGYKIKNYYGKNEAVIKGDAKSASIACASIIAKVYRDNLMKKYAEQYPQYDFDKNVGYGSQKHIAAIKEHGICKIHRKSFVRNLLE